ncbi:hypothetical protein ACIRON_08945 [Nocardioides sp. NPDC101246]|uniref:hypothetical protein n=1 Tax=Nocardioides sp. NPDC101246 TaxID=3364336 RepID=UPI003808C56A
MTTAASTDTHALYTDPGYEPTLEEWNLLVHKGGAAYKSELSARTVFESELFGMNTYIVMSMMEDYLRVPDRIRTILAHTTATDLVRSQPTIGTKKSFINLAAMPLHYLTGRELYVDLGETSLEDGLEDQLTVLRFWREATIATRRDGVLFNMDADPADSCRVVDDAQLGAIRDQLLPADDAMRTSLRKLGARLTAYAFLENCDARTAVCDTGPYHLGDGTFLALRELCLDKYGEFPWLDGIREDLAHHQFVLAFRLPDTVKMENNVWGTAWFQPSDYLGDLIEARVFVNDDEGLRPLGADEIDDVTSTIRKAHRRLYQRLAETEAEERNLYATQMYAWKLKSWARMAGCYDEIDWSVSPSVVESYDRFKDSDVALGLIGGVFVPQDRDGCFRPLGGQA